MQITDFTGSQFVSLFSEVLEQMIGMTVDQLGKIKDDQGVCKNVFFLYRIISINLPYYK